jgi:LysR family transcriptional regulator for metE and metH
MKIETRDLELIRFVAEDGSLTSAARRMHVSQPACSQRLASLQSRVGTRLFERKDGQMRPTPSGERLVATAGAVKRELDAALGDIRHILEQRGERLRVTTQCYTCYRWLPFVIRDMRRLHPDLSLDVVPEATDRAYDALADGQVDLAIVSNPQPGSGFDEYELFTDELFAVMSTDHPLARRKLLDVGNFSGQTLVLYTGKKHLVIEEVLKPAGVAPGRVIQVGITEAIVELARAGQGIAVLAGWVFSDLENRDGLVAVRIGRGGFKRSWRAVVGGRGGSRKSTRNVKDFVKCVGELGGLMTGSDWRKRAVAKVLTS